MNLINTFFKKTFEFESKRYTVLECYVKSGKNHIVTARRHFVYDNEQLADFMSKIEWLDALSSEVVVKEEQSVVSFGFSTVSDGLMDMFTKLATTDEPSKELLNKAKTMSSLAGSLVNVAKLQLDCIKHQSK